MGTANMILKIKLLFLSLFHLRSQPSPPFLLKRYSYRDIKRATDGFRRVVDNSSQEASYKAKFLNGRVGLVREVKLLDDDEVSFPYEVQLLGRLHHRHILALYGFSTGPKRFLVFENIESGSLKEHLSDPLKTPLNWRTRLKIAVGIAAAVEYLQFFCDPPVFRVSISSSTIMLDENFTPKISDISLSSAAENHATENPTSSRCPEECRDEGCRNVIFQLGLVILELITGVDMAQWVQEPCFLRSIHKMIDPDLGNSYDARELNGLLNVARLCIRSIDETRIYTPQILWYLQKKIRITRK
ncbi:hypothetical protein SASPL_104738 [Salvia splendens]|uniref:Protein kinase domain-containing protein n=1 Tax=Salvia splendens TaxID=180675 RepID=A0A8X8YNB6_SALSN|nr:probable receptor-like protein kinase At1g49730 isoform X2 [Salvia splendens]KAG6433130.1 hypothetical protein SASPL_104738 [Salvia splendens]